jgi:hypothetical protein
MKKNVFFILFCLFVSSFAFSQSKEDRAMAMFKRITDRANIWWDNNYSSVFDFSFTPRTTSNIQIVSLVIAQQLKINIVIFQNVVKKKELTEEGIYFFYIEQLKLLTYLRETIGSNTEGKRILDALSEETNKVAALACLSLIEQ